MDRWLWNPHIVDKLHPAQPVSESSRLFSSALPDEIEACQKTFVETFKKAKKLAPRGIPLAYRLTPTLEDGDDGIGVQKFGGLPDILQARYMPDYAQQRKMGESPKVKHYGPTEFIKRKWPRCKCCGSPMIFVGQIEITAWTHAIHDLTCLRQLPTYSDKPDPRYWRSAMGFADDASVMMSRDWLTFWFCDNGHFDEWAPDCVVIPTTKYSRMGGRGPDLYPHKWSEADYAKAARAFVKKNKIRSLPLKLVKDYKLTFDMDPQEYPNWKTPTYGKMEKLRDHPLFSQSGEYHLFGAPSSQQEERRFVCQNRYRLVHAMAPLLCWGDDEHDTTHQMYGCLGCRDRHFGPAYGKMDSSCT